MFGINVKLPRLRQNKQWLMEERARQFDAREEKTFAQKAMQFIERISHLKIHKFVDYESYLRADTEKVWATFRACHLVAGVLLKTQYQIIDQKGMPVVKVDPNLARLFQDPNPWDSWEELVYVWTHHMKVTGNAYWYKDEMNGRGQPTGLYPLMPQNMRVVPDRINKVAAYQYYVNGRHLEFLPDEIIHFRRPHPRDSIMGIGDIEPSQPLFNTAINQDTYQERFMENGAAPSGILINKEPMDDQSEFNRLRAWWNREYAGKRNIGKTAFLSGEWTYQQLGMSAQQMQSIEREMMTVKHIFLAHGVPLSVAGIEKAANLATARLEEINFRKYECVPLVDMLMGKLNSSKGFVSTFGDGIRVSYVMSGLIDAEQASKDYLSLLQNGAITPNEYRELCGLGRTDNPLHDQCYMLTTMAPLEMSGMTEPPEGDIQQLIANMTTSKSKRGRGKGRKLTVGEGDIEKFLTEVIESPAGRKRILQLLQPPSEM